MDAKRIQKMLSQRHAQWGGQYPAGSDSRRVWVKLTPLQVIDMLDDCAHAAKHMARQVLMGMESREWRIQATAHPGGQGDARGADSSLHITLRVGNLSYHLRCKEAPVLYIMQITR